MVYRGTYLSQMYVFCLHLDLSFSFFFLFNGSFQNKNKSCKPAFNFSLGQNIPSSNSLIEKSKNASFGKQAETTGQNLTEVLCSRAVRFVLTVTPKPYQTVIINLSLQIKTQKEETNSNFIAVLMKYALCVKTQ